MEPPQDSDSEEGPGCPGGTQECGLQGRVLVVTGGCGFLGSHLVRLLLEREPELRELRVLDLNPDPGVVPPEHAARVRLLRVDVGDARAVGRALWGAHVVFHAASLVDVWGRSSAQDIARVNVQGTKNVIRGCRAGGVPVLIYTSSMEVVGPNTRGDPFLRGDEDTPYPARHVQPYPLSKAQAERLVLEANGATVAGGGRLVTVSLRPTGIYGERHPLLRRLYLGGRALGGWLPRTLPPHAEHGRVYVGNVAWMHVLAARAALLRPQAVGGESFFCYDSSPLAAYEDFNQLLLGPAGLRLIGRSPPPRPLLELLARLGVAAGRVLPGPAPLLTPYTLAVGSTPFSVRTRKAERSFGYRPLFPWERARDRTLRWLRGLGSSP